MFFRTLVACVALAASASAQSCTPPFNPLLNVPNHAASANAVRRKEEVHAARRRAEEGSSADKKGGKRGRLTSGLSSEGEEEAFVRGIVKTANVSPPRVSPGVGEFGEKSVLVDVFFNSLCLCANSYRLSHSIRTSVLGMFECSVRNYTVDICCMKNGSTGNKHAFGFGCCLADLCKLSVPFFEYFHSPSGAYAKPSCRHCRGGGLDREEICYGVSERLMRDGIECYCTLNDLDLLRARLPP